MDKYIEIISSEYADKLCHIGDSFLRFDKETPLVYEGHIPIVAYILIEGSLLITKRKKEIEIIHPYALVGRNELANKIPLKYKIQAMPKTKLGYLNRSQILNLMKNTSFEKYQIKA